MKKEQLIEKFICDNESFGLIDAIQSCHNLKFPTDLETQERKLNCELNEFYSATTLEEKVDEAVDIIISAIGFLERAGRLAGAEIFKKFLLDLNREYPDNFQHSEKEDKKND